MAAYREHISVSGLLGVGYAATGVILGFTPVQAALAGILTGIGGMLPDLDSETGTPVRNLTSITAAAVPPLLLQHLHEVGGNEERGLLAGVLLYFILRYGGKWLLGKLTVHRGMFHSVPAMGISGGIVFLLYCSDETTVKLLMACGVMTGFLSHLVLDEIYSVEWSGARIRLKKSAGSALKSVSRNVMANTITYGLLFGLSYACLLQTTMHLEDIEGMRPAPIATTLDEAPVFDPDAEGVPESETPPIPENADAPMFAEDIPLDVPRRL